LYRIQADRIIDIGANYIVKNSDGQNLGRIKNHGLKSFWKASYSFFDKNEDCVYVLTEKNPWVKIIDSLIGEIPVLSFFSGFLFNPEYEILDSNNNRVATLKKIPTLLSRKFIIQPNSQSSELDNLLLLGTITALIFQKDRG
jgi:hypothetical protein